ncbi:MAG: PilZ domain-containing protein [Nitrospira sp.]|nr:PilZ domain-containing protein [Nitrospira sp.]
MEQTRPYQREHYRLPLPVSYPVMFSDAATIGEGLVTNLSVFGCTIECADTVPKKTTLLLRLLLPDQKKSLPIEQAEVRWVRGKQVGLRFGHLERAANLRLHLFVWDRMIERLQSLKQAGAPLSYS